MTMNKQDRTEVREMIENTLGGWHSDTVLREVTTNKALDNIDKHLGALNGKVLQHSKELEQLRLDGVNHIVNCPVNPKVNQLAEDLLEYKMFKKYPKLGVLVLIIALGLVTLNVFDIFDKSAISKNLNKTESVDAAKLEDSYKRIILTIDSLRSEIK